MPHFVLNRNFTLASTQGRVVNFIKGHPTFVVPGMVGEATAIGAVSVDGEVFDPLGPEVVEKAELTPEQRKDALMEAYRKLELRNQRGDYNAQGLPTLQALEGLVGFKPITPERNDTFQAYREAKAG